MKQKVFLLLITCCIASVGICQDTVKNGLKVWTSDWDEFSLDTGYKIYQWTYQASDNSWALVEQPIVEPMIAGETYIANVWDMGMSMITLRGRSDVSGILTVSEGDGHFPSLTTEFQHRRLNAKGEWELVQPPLFTTPVNVSPLGAYIYYDGNDLHLAWVEDNDSGGPHSMMCEIFDLVYTVDADGKLSSKGDKTMVFSQTLDWSGTHGGLGGITGVTVCDYDGDGDLDFIVGEMFYGDSPAGASVQLIERLGPSTWSTSLKELWYGQPGHGSEAVKYADINGDKNVDLIITSGTDQPWSNVVWLEKRGNTLTELGPILQCDTELKIIDQSRSVGHIFGLDTNRPLPAGVADWEVF